MKVSRWCPLLSLTMVSLLAAAPTKANDNWWFDVEVIVFERKLDLTELDEQFEFADSLAPPLVEADVIGDAIVPNISWLKQGLPKCNALPAPRWPDIAPQLIDTDSPEPRLHTLVTDDTISEISSESSEVSEPAHFEPPSIAVEQEARNFALEMFLKDSELNAEISVPEVSACETIQPWMTFQNGQWHTHRPDNHIPAPSELPITPEGFDWPKAGHAHLLPSSSQQLTSLSRQIRQNRDLTRLLHVTWRQPVLFGKDNAFNIRLFAGQNFADRFSLTGEPRVKAGVSDDELLPPVTEQSDSASVSPSYNFFDKLEQKLSAPTPVDFSYFSEESNLLQNEENNLVQQSSTPPIWQLDGSLKVFLKYINRVPYLHIDSELFYRQPIPLTALMPANENTSMEDSVTNSMAQTNYRLVSVPFSEQRRVISKQLHYFDHPLFGMVVEIRRYKRPSSSTQ
jgi:hypothetical protein